MFWHGLAWHQKMPRKSSFQQSQTWYECYTQVFEKAKFLGDLTIYIVEICQDNFFLHMLPNIFHNLMTALHPQPSPQFFIMLLFY